MRRTRSGWPAEGDTEQSFSLISPSSAVDDDDVDDHGP